VALDAEEEGPMVAADTFEMAVQPGVSLGAKEGVVDSALLTEVEKGSFELTDVSVAYGTDVALAGVSLSIKPRAVTALVGPSGCGKSTLLRCLNRMNDEIGNVKVTGRILFDGEDIYAKEMDPVVLRKRVGQVFQRPNPFPMSIYDNVAYGPRTHGIRAKSDLDTLVEDSLKRAALWSEVRNNVKKHAFELSGGQQQRLCIARALATMPEVLLMDEPASALDPISSQQIEDTIGELAGDVTIVIVTHNMQQAARVSGETVFLLRETIEDPAFLVEVGDTRTMFTSPEDSRTEAYITGRFG
jgi:phosphate transport system ATP-binding protein